MVKKNPKMNDPNFVQHKSSTGTVYVRKIKPGDKRQVINLEENTRGKKKIARKEVVEEKPYEYLTEEQKIKYNTILKEYSFLSNEDLKELLTKNRQVKSGTRDELLSRCVEGKLLGALTNCPKCKKERLTFKIKTGLYLCKGFVGGKGLFVECGYKSDLAKRLPWRD